MGVMTDINVRIDDLETRSQRAPNQNEGWVNTKRGSGSKNQKSNNPVNEIILNDDHDDEVFFRGTAPPHPQEYTRPTNGSKAPRGRTGGHFRGQHRGRGGQNNGSHRNAPYQNPRHNTEIQEVDISEEYGNRDYAQPRRSSHTGAWSRQELVKIVRQEIMNQKCHDEAAGYDVIIDGLPSYKDDNFVTEADRAFDKLVQILPEFKIDFIYECERFYTRNLDGTLPLKVTLRYPSVVAALIERAKNEGKFPWFRPSRSKELRKKIAYEHDQVQRLNARLPPNSALKWEVLELGLGAIRRRVPNPDHIPLKNATDHQQGQVTEYARPQAATRKSMMTPVPPAPPPGAIGANNTQIMADHTQQP